MICFWISLKQNTLRKDPSSLKIHIQLQDSQLCLHCTGSPKRSPRTARSHGQVSEHGVRKGPSMSVFTVGERFNVGPWNAKSCYTAFDLKLTAAASENLGNSRFNPRNAARALAASPQASRAPGSASLLTRGPNGPGIPALPCSPFGP